MTQVKEQPTETKTRKPPVHGMKWLRLGTNKDPEFKTTYLLYRWGKDEALPYYSTGTLRSKTEGESNIVYLFHDEKTGEASADFTHYCHPKPPAD